MAEMAKFAAANDRFLDSRKNTYKNEACLYNGMNALTQLITVSAVVFGGIGIANASLDLADLITYLLYIGYLAEPIQKLNHVTMQCQEGITGFQRFMEILEIEPDIRDSLESLAANRTTIVIAHRLSTIRNAERIVVLTDRGIEEQGTHDELMAAGGTYARLYAGLAGS